MKTKLLWISDSSCTAAYLTKRELGVFIFDLAVQVGIWPVACGPSLHMSSSSIFHCESSKGKSLDNKCIAVPPIPLSLSK